MMLDGVARGLLGVVAGRASVIYARGVLARARARVCGYELLTVGEQLRRTREAAERALRHELIEPRVFASCQEGYHDECPASTFVPGTCACPCHNQDPPAQGECDAGPRASYGGPGRSPRRKPHGHTESNAPGSDPARGRS